MTVRELHLMVGDPEHGVQYTAIPTAELEKLRAVQQTALAFAATWNDPDGLEPAFNEMHAALADLDPGKKSLCPEPGHTIMGRRLDRIATPVMGCPTCAPWAASTPVPARSLGKPTDVVIPPPPVLEPTVFAVNNLVRQRATGLTGWVDTVSADGDHVRVVWNAPRPSWVLAAELDLEV